MKKQITAFAVGTLLAVSMPATAFAANPVRPAALTTQATVTYAACTVEGCNAGETHQHNGTSYAGHTLGDGHCYHQLCAAADCTQTGTHDHNATTYFGHHSEDGHTYHNNSTGGHNSHRGRAGHHS